MSKQTKAPTERDELTQIIDDRWHGYGYNPQGAADAILAAGYRKPRTVTTVEELDALPEGTIILDTDPDALVTDGTAWRSLLVPDCALRSSAVGLPATVLHEGGCNV